MQDVLKIIDGQCLVKYPSLREQACQNRRFWPLEGMGRGEYHFFVEILHPTRFKIGEESSFTTTPSSLRWAARELFNYEDSRDTLSIATDAWSFGMVCLELMTGDHPFSNVSLTSS
jgi:serine/threonine protein kinase